MTDSDAPRPGETIHEANPPSPGESDAPTDPTALAAVDPPVTLESLTDEVRANRAMLEGMGRTQAEHSELLRAILEATEAMQRWITRDGASQQDLEPLRKQSEALRPDCPVLRTAGNGPSVRPSRR